MPVEDCVGIKRVEVFFSNEGKFCSKVVLFFFFYMMLKASQMCLNWYDKY